MMDSLPAFIGTALLFMAGARKAAAGSHSTNSTIEHQSKKQIQDTRLQDRSRFRPGQCKTKVVSCRSVAEYEQCIERLVLPGDNVLAIHTQNDQSDASIARMRQRSSRGSVTLFAGKDMWDIQAFMATPGPVGVVCLNGTECFGNDLLQDSLSLIRVLRGCYEPHLRTIIVKSKTLSQHSYRYLTSTGLQRRLQQSQLTVQGAMIVCTVGVTEYRSVIPLVVRRGDSVLEIGCARGTTVKALVPHVGSVADGGRCIGIDVGKVCVEASRGDHKTILEENLHVSFELGNAWDISRLLELAGHFNTVFVDVGGISGVDGEMEGVALVRQLTNTFNNTTDPAKQLRYIVIKSRCLRDHANTFCTANETLGAVQK